MKIDAAADEASYDFRQQVVNEAMKLAGASLAVYFIADFVR